jgi:hypothetical protein
MTKIILDGFDRFDRKLSDLGRISEWAQPLMMKAVLYVQSQVPPYPAPPPDSRYRRTGTLGRSITSKTAVEVKGIGNDVVGTLGTAVVYAPYVISSERIGSRGPQTRVHKATGWYTLQAVVEKSATGVMRVFEQGIRALLR